MTGRFKYGTRRLLAGAVAVLAFCFTAQAFSAPLEIQCCNSAGKALVKKLFNQGFSGGNLAVLDEVMSKDIHFDDPMFPPGLEGIKALVKKNNDSFEGWHFKMHDLLCDADKVIVRWTGYGRHVASFMGEPATRNNIELNGISIYQVKAGRIVADWVIPDNLGFLMQIGVLEPVDMTGVPENRTAGGQ